MELPRRVATDLTAMELPRRVATTSPPPSNRLQHKRKPIIEKRRRSRINSSMAQLERLLPATGSGRKAMEKADILEKTVEYVQRLQQQLKQLQMATTSAVQRRVLCDLGNVSAAAAGPSQPQRRIDTEDANPWRPWSVV